ncbi:MAG: hypothetical protein ACRD6U_05955 [Nitrososphaeraceae archaeon]
MGNELKEKILTYNGIVIETNTKNQKIVMDCPRCQLVNAIENKYCSKCSYPLKPEAYDEIKLSEEIRIKSLETKYENDMKGLRNDMNNQFNHIISMIQQNPLLANIKPEVLLKKN